MHIIKNHSPSQFSKYGASDLSAVGNTFRKLQVPNLGHEAYDSCAQSLWYVQFKYSGNAANDQKKIQIYIVHIIRSYFFDKFMMLNTLFRKPQLSAKLFIVSIHVSNPHALIFQLSFLNQNSGGEQLSRQDREDVPLSMIEGGMLTLARR